MLPLNRVLDLTKSLTLSVTSNGSGLLIQNDCNRTEYLSGLYERLTVEVEGDQSN